MAAATEPEPAAPKSAEVADDPLDQFMAGINEQVQEEKASEAPETSKVGILPFFWPLSWADAAAQVVRDDLEAEDNVESFIKHVQEHGYTVLVLLQVAG